MDSSVTTLLRRIYDELDSDGKQRCGTIDFDECEKQEKAGSATVLSEVATKLEGARLTVPGLMARLEALPQNMRYFVISQFQKEMSGYNNDHVDVELLAIGPHRRALLNKKIREVEMAYKIKVAQ